MILPLISSMLRRVSYIGDFFFIVSHPYTAETGTVSPIFTPYLSPEGLLQLHSRFFSKVWFKFWDQSIVSNTRPIPHSDFVVFAVISRLSVLLFHYVLRWSQRLVYSFVVQSV